jgi:hypothetical protein
MRLYDRDMTPTAAPTARTYFRGAHAVVRNRHDFCDGATYRLPGLFTADEARGELARLGDGWHVENLNID